jgi:hypothetical protein
MLVHFSILRDVSGATGECSRRDLFNDRLGEVNAADSCLKLKSNLQAFVDVLEPEPGRHNWTLRPRRQVWCCSRMIKLTMVYP